MPTPAVTKALFGIFLAVAALSSPSAIAQSHRPHITGLQPLLLQVFNRAVPYIRASSSKDGDQVDMARMPTDGSDPRSAPPSRGSEGPAPRPLSDSDDFVLGFEIDAGIPHVVGGNVIFEPWNFLQLRIGGAYNLVAAGLRAGLTFAIPVGTFLQRVTLSGEGGHFFEGDINFLTSFFSEDSGLASAGIRSISYDYATGMLGMELGSERFRFILNAGAMYLNATATGDTGSTEATGWIIAPAGRLSLAVFVL